MKVLNTLKTTALPADLGFTVQLPAGVVYGKSKVTPAIYEGASANGKRITMQPDVDTAANTVTWTKVPMPGKARKTFIIWARVEPTATSPLDFDSWLWQDGVSKNPYCFNHAPAQSVRSLRACCRNGLGSP